MRTDQPKELTKEFTKEFTKELEPLKSVQDAQAMVRSFFQTEPAGLSGLDALLRCFFDERTYHEAMYAYFRKALEAEMRALHQRVDGASVSARFAGHLLRYPSVVRQQPQWLPVLLRPLLRESADSLFSRYFSSLLTLCLHSPTESLLSFVEDEAFCSKIMGAPPEWQRVHYAPLKKQGAFYSGRFLSFNKDALLLLFIVVHRLSIMICAQLMKKHPQALIACLQFLRKLCRTYPEIHQSANILCAVGENPIALLITPAMLLDVYAKLLLTFTPPVGLSTEKWSISLREKCYMERYLEALISTQKRLEDLRALYILLRESYAINFHRFPRYDRLAACFFKPVAPDSRYFFEAKVHDKVCSKFNRVVAHGSMPPPLFAFVKTILGVGYGFRP